MDYILRVAILALVFSRPISALGFENSKVENTKDEHCNSSGDNIGNATDDDKVFYTAQDSASWAIFSKNLSTVLGADKQSLYDNFISECNEAFMKEHPERNQNNFCDSNDDYRIKMSQHQPSSVYNYTKEGYKKIRAPPELFSLIQDFWEKNRNKSKVEWDQITVYHNTWDSPPTITHLHSQEGLQSKIWEMTKPILEEWTGHHLTPVSLWGVRSYHNGSILTPHVDRMPLISSAIIQVDQDVDEPWPLEVYGHNGIATNVTMEPGDMVLYESHSVIHGRPFPLVGNFYANCFIHFEINFPLEGESKYNPELDVPPYIIPGSFWEKEWKKTNPGGWKGKAKDEDIRILATKGDMAGIQKVIHENPELLHKSDNLGWTIFHETVRSGKLDIVKLLLSYGIDKDLLTKTGVTPLNIALQYHGDGSDVAEYLRSIGAEDISPHKKRQQKFSRDKKEEL